MNTIVSAVLGLIEALMPLVSQAGVVAQIITALESILPLVVQEVETVGPMVKNIISAITKSGGATDADVQALLVLDAQVDAAFDAALAAAQAADAAAAGGAS